ncbi:membrane-bound lytic murein transglycosylase MltF [Marinobacter vulgaris]|uniref:Membrane-bound lytic murein transglycosylase F n=1 Tax=Marinobacter vulgaris TaxID=1928331 RepID=A0A2V3ZGV0_9GAMM|nr:membrane-bound lytic murein transglycosylase MltF [Marinobacter vulgaris]PXX88737.1 membrane-bound lytic murein transglycosylase MltF [Marinobacter vulgaris]TSJ66397.1 membrane-bound lytic murein transglycosylase MltF [Marinobacter vulgaris]
MLAIALVTVGCSRPSTLQEIRSEGVLHVITRNAPSVYYEGRNGPTGYDYELVRLFADDLGVELKVRVADDNTGVLSVIDQDYAHIGLAGLADRPDFADRYHKVANGLKADSVVVYNRDTNRPDSVKDLEGQTLHLVADSNHEHQLKQLQSQNESLQWKVHSGLDAAGILARVESGEYPLAIVSSNELDLNHVFFPMVKSAFSLDDTADLVWLFPAEQDQTLAKAAESFISELRESGALAQISERFYGHLDRLNYVGARTFTHHVENRLPKYESLFRDYASSYDLDWRLLAAIGYQESHWRPNAVSPTGVRGLMMLTRATANHIGIKNRLDVEQSIQGGAKYLTMVHRKVPERIPEPDRTWFALASYNVGWGHVEDARRLTQGAGKDPDRWMDVKEFLPLLAQKEWYSKTRFGYARGHEPVIYVQNIRRYYDVLAWMTEPKEIAETPDKPWFKDLEGMEKIIRPSDAASQHETRASLPSELGLVPPTL